MKLKIKNSEIYWTNYQKETGLLTALLELRSIKAPMLIQYNCLKSLEECKKEAKICQDEKKRILTEKALKDEKGNYILESNGEFTYETTEIKKDIIDQLNDLDNLEVEIEIQSVPLKEAFSMKEPITGELLEKLIGKFFVE
jgi:hypothetical protein